MKLICHYVNILHTQYSTTVLYSVQSVTVMIVTVMIKMNIAFYALRKLKVLYCSTTNFFITCSKGQWRYFHNLIRIKNLLSKPVTCVRIRTLVTASASISQVAFFIACFFSSGLFWVWHSRLRERAGGSQFGRGDRHCGTLCTLWLHVNLELRFSWLFFNWVFFTAVPPLNWTFFSARPSFRLGLLFVGLSLWLCFFFSMAFFSRSSL
jgi:hypothetical protein